MDPDRTGVSVIVGEDPDIREDIREDPDVRRSDLFILCNARAFANFSETSRWILLVLEMYLTRHRPMQQRKNTRAATMYHNKEMS